MSESITRGGGLVFVGKAPFYFSKRWRPCSCGEGSFLFFKELETLFLWVKLLFIIQRGGDLVLVGKAPFYYSKRWRPCSCG